VKGEILELKETINTMVPSSTRLRGSDARGARMGTEGKLGGQAEVSGVAAVEGYDRLRQLDGSNLTGQVRNIADRHDGVGAGTSCGRSPST